MTRRFHLSVNIPHRLRGPTPHVQHDEDAQAMTGPSWIDTFAASGRKPAPGELSVEQLRANRERDQRRIQQARSYDDTAHPLLVNASAPLADELEAMTVPSSLDVYRALRTPSR